MGRLRFSIQSLLLSSLKNLEPCGLASHQFHALRSALIIEGIENGLPNELIELAETNISEAYFSAFQEKHAEALDLFTKPIFH